MINLTTSEKIELIGVLSVLIEKDEKGIKDLINEESIIIVASRIRQRKEILTKIKESFKNI